MHVSRLVRHLPVEYKVGQRYQGFENVPAPTPPLGHMDAIEPLTGKQKWRTPVGEIPNYSAMLATAGGLLFTGKQTGEFIAVDMDTGKILCEFKTELGHQRAADHLHAQGKAVRQHPVGLRRGERGKAGGAAHQHPARRLGMDVRLDGVRRCH